MNIHTLTKVANSTLEIGIKAYEHWMKAQVAQLFSMQYGVPEQQFAALLENFYEHPYQRDHCIRVVACSGERVLGFQSFFFWPYTLNGKTFRSWQSGNSLVHPDCRGKGVFQRLLNFVEEQRAAHGIDFLMGFPVEDSYKSFMRNGWNNLLDLQWYVQPVSPLSLLVRDEHRGLAKTFSTSRAADATHLLPHDAFRLHADAAFNAWRKHYAQDTTYYYHTFRQGSAEAQFTLKPQRRKTYLKELVVGDVATSSDDPAFIKAAFHDLRHAARRSRSVTLLSFAANPNHALFTGERMRSCGFRAIDKKIYFILKPFADIPALTDASRWMLFRSDIDTW